MDLQIWQSKDPAPEFGHTFALNLNKIMVFENCNKKSKIQVNIEGVTLDRIFNNKFLRVIFDEKNQLETSN